MAVEKIHIVLTNEEYNLLNYISSETKTDCWFMLDEDEDGGDCVYDLENKQKISLDLAIQQLNEAIIPELLDLQEEEIVVYSALLNKLNVNNNPFK